MEEDYQLNMNFMDSNPQTSVSHSTSRLSSKNQKRSGSPESTRIQPHLHTIGQENANPLSARRSVQYQESSSAPAAEKNKLANFIRTSMKKVQLHEYQHDITQMTMYNIVPSPRDDRDWNGEAIFDFTWRLPKKIDLRQCLQPPRNQGYQGTCAAHVAASMKEWQEYQVSKSKALMSPQFIYNNRNNQMTTGMYGRDIMNILKNVGCCTEEMYPYEKIEPFTEIEQKHFDEAAKMKIKGYARVSTIECLKRALLVNGPCYISFPIYNNSNFMWRQHKGEKKLGGHAMTVVGYDKKGFIVRNSWGTYWDKKGYGHYPYTDWGCHYEIWTTIDDKSDKPPKRKYTAVKCYKKMAKGVNYMVEYAKKMQEDSLRANESRRQNKFNQLRELQDQQHNGVIEDHKEEGEEEGTPASEE